MKIEREIKVMSVVAPNCPKCGSEESIAPVRVKPEFTTPWGVLLFCECHKPGCNQKAVVCLANPHDDQEKQDADLAELKINAQNSIDSFNRLEMREEDKIVLLDVKAEMKTPSQEDLEKIREIERTDHEKKGKSLDAAIQALQALSELASLINDRSSGGDPIDRFTEKMEGRGEKISNGGKTIH